MILKTGIVGSGAMGSGIAQVAAMAGHDVIVYDSNVQALEKGKNNLTNVLNKLQEKGKIPNAEEVMSRIRFVASIADLKDTQLIIEAIVENIDIKKSCF